MWVEFHHVDEPDRGRLVETHARQPVVKVYFAIARQACFFKVFIDLVDVAPSKIGY